MLVLQCVCIGLLLTAGVVCATLAERAENLQSLLLVSFLSIAFFAGAVHLHIESLAYMLRR